MLIFFAKIGHVTPSPLKRAAACVKMNPTIKENVNINENTKFQPIQGESKKTDTFDIQMNNKGVSFF